MFSTQEMMDLMLMLYNYEPEIIKLIEKLTTTYTFTSSEELKYAVDMWCNDESREEAEKKYDDISKWDTSKITDMARLFKDKKTFNDDITNWDVSNVINMSNMFDGAASFNQNINGWNISSLTNVCFMFNCAISFNQHLDNWDLSNIKYKSYMFNGAVNMKGNCIKRYKNLLIVNFLNSY